MSLTAAQALSQLPGDTVERKRQQLVCHLLSTTRNFEGTKRKETKKKEMGPCQGDGRDRARDGGGRLGMAELSSK